MPNFKKFLIIFLFSALLIFLLSDFAFAQQELEIEYPEIMGWRPVTSAADMLPEYIRYIFNFALAISGLIIFAALIYGGVRYLTSVGDPSKMKDGLDQIFAGVLGFIILFSSYLILTTINPQLIILTIERPEPPVLTFELPGVYLFANEKWSPSPYSLSASNLEDFNDQVTKIRIENPKVWDPEREEWLLTGDYAFGAVLHEDIDYQGRCKIFLDAPEEEGRDVGVNQPSSISVFRKTTKTPYGQVTLCSQPEGQGTCQDYTSADPAFLGGLDNNVWSIEISGPYFVVLFEDAPDRGKCAVFTSSVPDLKNSPMNKCRPGWDPFGFFAIYESCASAVAVYPI